MTTSPWGAVAIASLGIATAGCAGTRFSACDDCDAGVGSGGSSGSSSGGGSGSGSGGTAGAAGSSGSSGSSGSAGSAGTRDAGGDSGGSAGTAGSAGTGGSQGGEGFPRTTVLDNFNRANGPPGSNWTGNAASYAIRDQRLAFVAGIGNAALWQSLLGAEQEVFATLAAVNPDAAEINVVLKAQEDDCELLEVLYSPFEQRLELTYCSGGSWHPIGGIPLTLQRGDQLGARFGSNNGVHVFVNGVRAAIFDASEYPHANRGGRIGVNCEANPDGTTAWDDFGGG